MTTSMKRRKLVSSLIRTMLASAFPIAGSIIVIYTLSGPTRRVAIVLTVVGVVGHIIHSMMELMDGDDGAASSADDAGLRGVLD